MQIDPALQSPVSMFFGALMGGSASLIAAIYTRGDQNRVERVASEIAKREQVYDFAMRKHTNWTFLVLLVIMLQAISIYMIAALALPDISGERVMDLRQHFLAHRSWFFGALLASVVFSLSKTIALSGHLPRRADSAFEFTFGAVAIVAAVIRSEWFHRRLAPATGVLFVIYIALLFGRLE